MTIHKSALEFPFVIVAGMAISLIIRLASKASTLLGQRAWNRLGVRQPRRALLANTDAEEDNSQDSEDEYQKGFSLVRR